MDNFPFAMTSLLLQSSTGKDKVKPSGKGQRIESKRKAQLEREEQDTADSRKVLFAERSDPLVSPNWINIVINMLCLCMSVWRHSPAA